MRKSLRNVVSAALLAASALVPIAATAGGPVNVLVLKENGVGSASTAQDYVDRLINHVGQLNAWTASSGKYTTTRSAATTYIKESDPHFGILSLPAFLALRDANHLAVVGSAEVTGGGGRQYFVVSASETSIAGCKGKILGTDHADDTRFIDKVVGKSDWSLGDFTVQDTKRPVATLKAVASGEVSCALIDDAQLAGLPKVDGGAAVKTVWKSSELPPMVVVAFPSAPAAEQRTFSGNLTKVCSGDGAAACKEVGLKALTATSETTYAGVVADYNK